MPNFVVLHDKYRSNGLEVVVGIAAHQQASTADEARASLDAWVDKELAKSELRESVAKILNGSWAVSDEAKALDAVRINRGRRRKSELSQNRGLVERILAKLEPAMKR
ncbi:hypothetical protein AB8Z38_17480 [Bradyrhizobium sp. LLZ17]|uniref:Uncharacterized protein n=1 Tax=Bradyrhizobium sp. LLZ17 TaxID=3239388 RepID=A0AB39XVZ6_9BRAD